MEGKENCYKSVYVYHNSYTTKLMDFWLGIQTKVYFPTSSIVYEHTQHLVRDGDSYGKEKESVWGWGKSLYVVGMCIEKITTTATN